MLEVVEGFADKPPTKEEVDRARQRYLAAREQAMTQSHSFALNLSEWAGAGDWRLMFIYRDRVAKITPEDVAARGRQVSDVGPIARSASFPDR